MKNKTLTLESDRYDIAEYIGYVKLHKTDERCLFLVLKNGHSFKGNSTTLNILDVAQKPIKPILKIDEDTFYLNSEAYQCVNFGYPINSLPQEFIIKVVSVIPLENFEVVLADRYDYSLTYDAKLLSKSI